MDRYGRIYSGNPAICPSVYSSEGQFYYSNARGIGFIIKACSYTAAAYTFNAEPGDGNDKGFCKPPDFQAGEGWIFNKSDRDERSCYLQITGAGREALNKDYKKLLAPAYRMYRKLGAQKFKLFMEIVEEANGELQNGKDDWQ